MIKRITTQFGFLSCTFRLIAIIGMLFTAGCTNLPFGATASPTPGSPVPTPGEIVNQLPQAEVLFDVIVPENTPADAEIFINVLDEVTGLALNAKRYAMQAGENFHYQAKLPIPLGSAVKYRYSREGSSSAIEHNTLSQQVRYRIAQVDGPMTVNDLVSSWSEQTYDGPTGRIMGMAKDQSSDVGISNLLVTAGGVETLTASDGSFVLEGLIPGTHNLILYALDGYYHTFQQGATVAANSTTPAPVSLAPAPLVNITFSVTVPSENVVGVPVRLAGNLYQTGNTYADLAGGISTIASRMPLLSLAPDGKYSVTLALPAGADFQYKYTIGDGFWNSEQTANGQFQVRQLIIPSADSTVQDTIASWRAGDSAPISFEVQAPQDTPSGDYLSIQFNPYGWTEPIPMWSLGNNRWLYVLYSPLNMLGDIGYRYCRNDQCGSADNAATQSPAETGIPFKTSQLPQNFQDDIQSWAWWSPSSTPTTVMAADVQDHGSGFFAGIEFQPSYHPSWQSRFYPVMQNLKSIGTNWITLTPTWTYTRSNPPVLEPVPGHDPLWFDLLPTIGQAAGIGLNTAIFPTPKFQSPVEEWWQDAPRDFSWWEVWFNRYEAFILHHADMAARSGAGALILGGEWIAPALPGGLLADGTPSGVPTDAEIRWRDIIEKVRSRYSGQVFWALNYPAVGFENSPAFLDAVDQIYLLFSPPLTDQDAPTEADLEIQVANLLDTDIAPLQQEIAKPLILALYYPSANGSAKGCIVLNSGGCQDPAALARPNPDVPSVEIDLQEQVDIYNAVFAQANLRSWIRGITSRGFYPPAPLQDKSASTHGKPAADIIWYWFPRLTGQTVD